MANIQEWLKQINEAAPLNEVGALMLSHNFTIEHMGGGCLAWMRRLDNGGHVLICDEGNGLGDHISECYIVGRYDDNSDPVNDGDCVDDLMAAILWCDKQEQV